MIDAVKFLFSFGIGLLMVSIGAKIFFENVIRERVYTLGVFFFINLSVFVGLCFLGFAVALITKTKVFFV